MEKLVIAGREFNSRLFLGTGKFHSDEVMEQSILASGTEMVTVAMKRIELDNKEDDMLVHIQHPGIQLLPNTSGVRNAEEAVFAAQMAREAFGTNWLKLEIHPRPPLSVAGFCGDVESHGGTGQIGLRSTALLSGRPHTVQETGRGRCRHRHATGCSYRHKQRTADKGFLEDNH